MASNIFLALLDSQKLKKKNSLNNFNKTIYSIYIYIIYPLGKFLIASHVAFVDLVSGKIVLEMASAPGAAIIDATIKWFAGTPKLI